MSVGRGANLNPPRGRQPRLHPFTLRLHLTAQLWCYTHDENILSACHPHPTPTSSFLMSSLLPCPTPSPPVLSPPFTHNGTDQCLATTNSPAALPSSLSHPSPRLAAPSWESRGSHTGRQGGDGAPSLNVKPPAAWTRLSTPTLPPPHPFLLPWRRRSCSCDLSSSILFVFPLKRLLSLHLMNIFIQKPTSLHPPRRPCFFPQLCGPPCFITHFNSHFPDSTDPVLDTDILTLKHFKNAISGLMKALITDCCSQTLES